ncbi:hypothetical protein Tco_0828877 [Tanacetum coccineum]
MHFNSAHSFVKDSCGHVHGLGMHNQTPHVGDNSIKDNLLPDLNVTLDKGEMEEHSDKELENLMASFQQHHENGMDQSQGISKNKRVKSKNKKLNIVGKSSSQPFLSQPVNNGALEISDFLRQIEFELGYSFSQGLSLNCNGLGCLVKHDWVKDLPGSWLGVHGKIGILNVYGPQSGHLKEILWTSIYSLLALVNVTWLIFRDFIVGRKFTRFVRDGSKANKLDRILVDRNFFDIWKDASVFLNMASFRDLVSKSWAAPFAHALVPPDITLKIKLKPTWLIIKNWVADQLKAKNRRKEEIHNNLLDWDVQGSQILDGCLIANEIVHMAKLEDQSFGLKWRKWISSCLSLASILVLINGSHSNNFFIERDLRQREPLSPFSLFLVVEALQVTILNACDRGIFKGVCLSNSGKNISLLQCADDALFFGEWKFYSSDGGFGLSILANSESGVWLDVVKACKYIEDKFPRLFALEIYEDCKVKDHGQVANNVSIGNWLWRIPPRGRALGDLNTLSSKLGNVKFSSYGSDKWSWSYDSSESFKVKILSKVLENNLLGDISLGLHYK